MVVPLLLWPRARTSIDRRSIFRFAFRESGTHYNGICCCVLYMGQYENRRKWSIDKYVFVSGYSYTRWFTIFHVKKKKNYSFQCYYNDNYCFTIKLLHDYRIYGLCVVLYIDKYLFICSLRCYNKRLFGAFNWNDMILWMHSIEIQSTKKHLYLLYIFIKSLTNDNRKLNPYATARVLPL